MSSVKKTIKFCEIEKSIDLSVDENRKQFGREHAEEFEQRLIGDYLRSDPEDGGYSDVINDPEAGEELVRRVNPKEGLRVVILLRQVASQSERWHF